MKSIISIRSTASAKSSLSPSAIPASASPQKSSELSDRKSTRLNSSHSQISYAVFCLKKNIDDPRRGALERFDLGRAAHPDDPPAGDGECLRNGEAVVDGDDLAIDQDRVRCLRPRRRR